MQLGIGGGLLALDAVDLRLVLSQELHQHLLDIAVAFGRVIGGGPAVDIPAVLIRVFLIGSLGVSHLGVVFRKDLIIGNDHILDGLIAQLVGDQIGLQGSLDGSLRVAGILGQMLKLAVELIAFQLGIGQIVALQLLQRVRVGGIHILFKLGLLRFTELIKAQRRGLLADDLLADHLILRLGLQLVKVNFRRLHAIHLVELLHLHFLVI